MAKYVIELNHAATGEIADVLVIETECGDELLAMVGGDLRPAESLPLSASDIESIVARFGVDAPEVIPDGWLRRWSFLDQLPYTVHTRRELRLMLAGEKPLAAFIDDMPDVPDNGIVPEEIFLPYVLSGRFVKRERESLRSGHACRQVLYALRSEAWRIWLDVVVTDEGIRKPFYGFRGVFVSWDAIKSARFVLRKEGGWMYILFTSSHPSLGTLRFTSAIGNAGHLVERVNDELLRRNVPIRTWKGSTLVAAERLPAPSDAYLT